MASSIIHLLHTSLFVSVAPYVHVYIDPPISPFSFHFSLSLSPHVANRTPDWLTCLPSLVLSSTIYRSNISRNHLKNVVNFARDLRSHGGTSFAVLSVVADDACGLPHASSGGNAVRRCTTASVIPCASRDLGGPGSRSRIYSCRQSGLVAFTNLRAFSETLCTLTFFFLSVFFFDYLEQIQ